MTAADLRVAGHDRGQPVVGHAVGYARFRRPEDKYTVYVTTADATCQRTNGTRRQGCCSSNDSTYCHCGCRYHTVLNNTQPVDAEKPATVRLRITTICIHILRQGNKPDMSSALKFYTTYILGVFRVGPPAPPGDRFWRTLTFSVTLTWFSKVPTSVRLPPARCSQCHQYYRYLD